MSHKREHTLNLEFTGNQNEIGGVVKEVKEHGNFVQVIISVDPKEMLSKQTEGIVACMMTKNRWQTLEAKLPEENGKKLALAVFTTDNVLLEPLPDD